MSIRMEPVFPRRKIVPIGNYLGPTMIVTTIAGAIALWWLGGSLKMSVGEQIGIVIFGALIGAGVGWILGVSLVQPIVNAIAGDFLSMLAIGVSMIGAIIGARFIWEGSGGNLTLTIIGAFGGIIFAWMFIGWILGFGPEE